MGFMVIVMVMVMVRVKIGFIVRVRDNNSEEEWENMDGLYWIVTLYRFDFSYFSTTMIHYFHASLVHLTYIIIYHHTTITLSSLYHHIEKNNRERGEKNKEHANFIILIFQLDGCLSSLEDSRDSVEQGLP